VKIERTKNESINIEKPMEKTITISKSKTDPLMINKW
jgi:hypothetical protein